MPVIPAFNRQTKGTIINSRSAWVTKQDGLYHNLPKEGRSEVLNSTSTLSKKKKNKLSLMLVDKK